MDSAQRILLANQGESASFISTLFFSWTVPIFKKGYKKSFSADDLCEPLKLDRSDHLGNKLQRKWQIECKNSEKPSLLRTILKTFWIELTIMATLSFINDVVFRLALPLLLGNLLTYFRKNSTMTHQDALIYGIAMISITIFGGISQIHYYFNGNHYGMNIRTAVCSIIYKKVLKLSKTALGDTAPGKIVNLLSNDVSRFESAMNLSHSLWSAPLMTIIAAYLLWREIQWSGIIGMVVVIIFVPFQSYAGKLSSKYRFETASRTDERVRFMDEIISGVQVIKMYAWERPFAALIRFARKQELQIVLKNAYVRAIYMSLGLFTTRIALFCTVLSFILIYGRENITVAKMFVVSALFNAISSGMCQTFVLGITQFAEALVAFQRLQAFLMYKEKVVDPSFRISKINGNIDIVDRRDIPILMKNASAWWIPQVTSTTCTVESENRIIPNTISNPTLQDLNIEILKGKLIGVIGPVGSGKSSLLQALLGELQLESGSIAINGTISYASQEPFLFAATARQNILFGEQFDNIRYQAVVECTALLRDFEQFSQGDLTTIGESGVSLSGGQKARINLARAVYRNADIYLLDDPLSAVDAHVGLHLFDKCIGPKGYLAHTTRVLITHQVHFLQEADWILVLRDGKIEMQGTYDSILNSGIDFASILSKSDPVDTNKNSQEDNSTVNGHTKHDSEQLPTKITTEEAPLVKVNNPNKEKQLIRELESSSKGKIKGLILLNWFKAAGQPVMFVIMIALFLLAQILASGSDMWVSYWIRVEETLTMERQILNGTKKYCLEHTNCTETDMEPTLNAETFKNAFVYGGIMVTLLVVAMTRSLSMFRMCVKVSQNLHDKMFASLISTTMRFFETNPSGRILNRFSKDIGTVDELLPKTFIDAAQINLGMLGAVVVTIIINPSFMIVIIGISILFFFIRAVYLTTSKDIKRLEGMTKSPVFSHISATLTGLSTIRAFNAQIILQQEFDNHQDLNTGCSYMYMATGSAFALSLEILVYIFITCVTTYFLLIETDATGDRVGLAITQSLTLSGLFKWGVRQSAEVENQLMSVERALEYCNLDGEVEPQIPNKVSKEWPSKGEIVFKDVFYRYYAEAVPVLRGISFVIHGKEKIGIVGRTGAGKSSLIGALFRLACIEGDIFIDGINTAQLELKDLRSKIAIIPQDPVLFSGTLRRNLDPFDEYDDADIFSSLEHVDLKSVACGPQALKLEVMARGSNFSVGQRQLLCLARAILRKNTILILDEATANVDPQTDLLIQQTIRAKFANCTVLTVAHRLHTIIDSDRILVMDAGIVAEFDTPYSLMTKSNSIFKGMVEALGANEFSRLFTISQNHDYKLDLVDK